MQREKCQLFKDFQRERDVERKIEFGLFLVFADGGIVCSPGLDKRVYLGEVADGPHEVQADRCCNDHSQHDTANTRGLGHRCQQANQLFPLPLVLAGEEVLGDAERGADRKHDKHDQNVDNGQRGSLSDGGGL